MTSKKQRPSSNGLPSAAPDISITGDQVTLYPSGYTESPASQDEGQDRNLVEHMSRFRESPLDFLREISLHVQGSGWRSYDNVVGQPIFYRGFTENMKSSVLASPMLNEKIKNLAQQRIDVEEKEGRFRSQNVSDSEKKKAKRKAEIQTSVKEVAETMTDQMICKMESKTGIRGQYYLATALLTRAYHQGIHVSSEEVLRLRAVAEKAEKERQSIIFLPCHRSHVDYVSLQLICYRLGLMLPTVVAGDNLNFPLVGPFLQHAGAMWIRRAFGDDQLYITVLQAYIDTLLQKGFNFECFIEGGRSRMGKLLPPKFGILGFLIDSLLSGRVKDAIVCPVSTQYDKVIEVDSYISELLGQPKPKENLADFLSASSILSLKLGRVDVRFHQPWSLRGFIQDQESRFNGLTQSQQSELNRTYSSNLRIRLLRTLGYKVLADINAVSVVMPTSLIGTVLLTLRGRGVGKSELIRRVEWLSERVRNQGGRVAHFAGLPTETVVERGLEVLGPKLVGVEKNLVEETYHAVDRFQLSFYRNMTIHLFVNQALISAGMYTNIKAGADHESQSISYPELFSRVGFLSQLFRGEFIFPAGGLESNVAQTLSDLERDNVVSLKRAEHGDNSTIEQVQLSEAERIEGRNNFDFYCFLIWPFIEAAWLGAVSCLMLTPPNISQNKNGAPLPASPWLDNKLVQNAAQHLGKTLFAQGDLSYFEAVNKETLKNAFERFEEEGIVQTRKPGKGAPKNAPAQLISLAPDWMPTRDPSTGALRPEGRLWDFCEEISRSRLEGKNRRDGEVVVGRVLRLVEAVSRSVWSKQVGGFEVAAGGATGEGEKEREEERVRRERRRRAPLMPPPATAPRSNL